MSFILTVCYIFYINQCVYLEMFFKCFYLNANILHRTIFEFVNACPPFFLLLFQIKDFNLFAFFVIRMINAHSAI